MNERITNRPMNLPTPEELERRLFARHLPQDNPLPDYPVCDFAAVGTAELDELRQAKKDLEELRKRLETPEGDWI